ncbi:ribokinase [Microbacteriaceae bacterium SG_E_30_P1]|uniref:Ribokinase n=1 Tax=Antiquaquibacter oligotrophicus TaxID=2880260 RepID=A0ABT6KKS9_9MICO|nr:ribokinase [Antiquaquibacter oligotrophicus]MDH6180615.1 ribokinase [Antiquaquibacter oligotrophicus]UDF13652.1 ribokinase [Antiquaquibacter oligotrophicus]
MAHQVPAVTPPRVVVVGSANVDEVFAVQAIPAPGETILSHGVMTARGGKGQNQAVAAARAGASTAFVGCLGSDDFGRLTLAGLTEDSIDTDAVRVIEAPTGRALIAVEPGGENTIIVEAGANADVRIRPEDRAVIADADVLLAQLEIPIDSVVEAAVSARDSGTLVIVNAAPMAALPAALLDATDVLVVNELEAQQLRGATGVTNLLDLVPVVVLTLGSKGAILQRREKAPVEVPAPIVDVVDATGAGDTFCGALAVALAEGMPDAEALRFSVTAASLSVQRAGAVPSIPTRAEIATELDRIAD